MTPQPMAPGDFLDLAEEITDTDLSEYLPGDMGALADQMRAAYRDNRHMLQLLGQDQVPAMGPEVDQARLIAVQMSLAASVQRRVAPQHHCRHLFDVTVPTTIFLGFGVVLCQGCGRNVIPSRMVDDGRCDLCEQHATIFWPHTLAVGGAMFIFDACKACAAFLRTVRPPADDAAA
jgi:hypothetical protein